MVKQLVRTKPTNEQSEGRPLQPRLKENLKESIMKKQVITIMVVAVFCATLAVSSIQAQNAGNMSVTIPFDFAVSGKTLPAGDYYLQRSTEGAQVVTQLRSRDKDEGVYLPQTHPVQGNGIQADSKLVFNKYGDQYFLSQVWISGRSSGAEVAKTSRERLLQHEMAKGRKPENINVAIRSK